MIQYLGEYGFKYSFVAPDVITALIDWANFRKSYAVTDDEFNEKIQEIIKDCYIVMDPSETVGSFIHISVDNTGHFLDVYTRFGGNPHSVRFTRKDMEYQDLDKKNLIDVEAYKSFVEEENERRKNVEQYTEYDPKAETKRKMSYQERVIELLEILCNTTFRIEDMLLERSGSNADISC